MSITVTWLGHGCWSIKTEAATLLLDPFLDDSPTAPIKADQAEADFILVSHGHFDHVADAAKIALRTGAAVVANFEICEWLSKQQGVQKTEPMNLGGGIAAPFGRIEMTLAHHSSQLPDGAYGGNPGGFLLTLGEKRLYFACDTALFDEMARFQGVDLAVLPIGDRFTMGPAAALQAVQMIAPKFVAPAHYNTWPPIAQDVHAWAKAVRQQTDAAPLVVQPGESFNID